MSDSEASDFPAAAQTIIAEIIGRLRHSGDLAPIIQFAIEALAQACQADRGLVWQLDGDQLSVTNEFAANGQSYFLGNQLSPQESTAIVLEFISRFPDDSGTGVIVVPDTDRDTNLKMMSPTLSSLIELGDVRARLMVQLRSRGRIAGFLELQLCGRIREWSRLDAVTLQCVGDMLSIVLQQSFDQARIEMDAKEMRLINEILGRSLDSREKSVQDVLAESVSLVADHMGFAHAQVYLLERDKGLLIPQVQDGSNKPLELTMKENPLVSAFESGRVKVVNAEPTREGDSVFGHDLALILPLVSAGDRLGVFGLWQRLPGKTRFRAQDKELALTIAGCLSRVIPYIVRSHVA
jgi:GAF domain-containing protein